MKIVSWNCRGLGNSSKVDDVKDLLRMDPSDVLLLQETKIDEDNLLSLSKKNWKKNAGLVVSARGSSGGIATLWTKNLFSMKNSLVTQHWIFFELRHLPSKISLLFLISTNLSISRRKYIVGILSQKLLLRILFPILWWLAI